MTPGLAIFYGGMVRAKSTLNMMMMSFSAIGVTTILWTLYAYSLAFGDGGSFFGKLDHIGLAGTINHLTGPSGHQIPVLAFSMFQLTFAVITVALLSGAIADRAKFSSWMIFAGVWLTLVYAPVAHAAFTADGFLAKKIGALDFAGGTVVEINSGAAALALALVLGKREGFKRDPMRPHNMPLVLLGAGLLWFGWFGFNAGSALQASSLAATAMINTQVATAAAAMSWLIVEKRREGKATSLGIASGAVAGAVAITPACGYVTPLGALVIGLIGGAVSAWAVTRKYRLGYDDSLDVVGVHGIGGFIGMIGIGLLATKLVNDAGADGLFINGSFSQLNKQLIASILTAAYSFLATWIIATVIQKTIGFRVDRNTELDGLDTTIHAESAYDINNYTTR
jgi:Amt family ammonium transporter